MNRIKLFFALSLIISLSWSCELLQSLDQSKVAQGLKEALRVGTDTSVAKTNRTNGYYGDIALRILLPEEAQGAVATVSAIAPGLVDELVLKINRAAEDAAGQAAPIFVDAITNITIQDAVGILNGNDDAATQYLKTNTKTQLAAVFQPIIEDALSSVGAQQLWQQFSQTYNSIPLVTPIPDNLAQHTTSKALDGLFVVVAREEAKIRNDVNHQVNDLLKEVFGNK